MNCPTATTLCSALLLLASASCNAPRATARYTGTYASDVYRYVPALTNESYEWEQSITHSVVILFTSTATVDQLRADVRRSVSVPIFTDPNGGIALDVPGYRTFSVAFGKPEDKDLATLAAGSRSYVQLWIRK
jgi:hypothetical protein